MATKAAVRPAFATTGLAGQVKQYSACLAECIRFVVFGAATETLHCVHSWSHGANATPDPIVSDYISTMRHLSPEALSGKDNGAPIPKPALYRLVANIV